MTRFFKDLIAYNPGTKAISIVIAILLWFVVLGSRNVEDVKEVPLEIVTASNIVIASEHPERVAFRLSGPKAFLRTIMDRRDDPIRVDLTAARPGSVTYRFFSDNIRLPIGVKVQAIQPPSVTVRLEEVRFKTVPVRVDVQGLPPEGFSILNTEVKPPEIEIRGAESAVGAVHELRTNPVDVSGSRKPVERKASFELKRLFVELNGNPPLVRVNVAATSANFKIKNVPVRVKADLKYRLRVREITVYVRASSEDLATLDEAQVYAEMDLTGRSKGRYDEKIQIRVPDKIAFVKAEPDSVGVLLY